MGEHQGEVGELTVLKVVEEELRAGLSTGEVGGATTGVRGELGGVARKLGKGAKRVCG